MLQRQKGGNEAGRRKSKRGRKSHSPGEGEAICIRISAYLYLYFIHIYPAQTKMLNGPPATYLRHTQVNSEVKVKPNNNR